MKDSLPYFTLILSAVSVISSIIVAYVSLSLKAAVAPILEQIKAHKGEIDCLWKSENDQWATIRHQGEGIARIQGASEESGKHRAKM